MMTGDNKPTALAIAKRVWIEAANVWANMSPKDKASASVITEMIEREDTVAMVCFVLRSTCYADTLMLFYPGRRRNRRLSSPHSCLRRHCDSNQGRYL